MVEVIYHIADIHIHNTDDRYDEYLKIFENVYKILEEDKRKKIIVICGDIFDKKTELHTRSIHFGSSLLGRLTKYGKLILIHGNHDQNMTNEKSISTIDSMLSLINTLIEVNNNKFLEEQRIIYLKENGIYKIDGINFILTTMFSKEVTKIINKKEDELYIGLYHGTLYKSRINDNIEMIDEKYFKVSDFKEYDIVLLGDIHVHQFLNKEKTIAYPSSLIQQHKGESIKGHGLIKWDLKNKKGEFIEIPNKYCYLKAKLEDGELIINEEVNLNDYEYIKATIEYTSIYKDKIYKYEKKLKEMYNIKEIVLFENTKNNDEDEKIDEVKIEEDIIEVHKKLIEKKNYTKEEKEEIKIIINKIIEENKLLKEKIVKKIELESIEFENLFCFGNNNVIKFNKLNKINGIIAENGWGKSSIIDALLYSIYQKCGRAKGTKVINKFKNNALSIIKFKLNDVNYEIKRKITRMNSKGEFREILEIYKNNILINCDTKRDTNNFIEEIFGSYDEITDNNILLQTGRNFIDKNDNEKKQTMYKIFGIDVYNQIYEKTNTIVNELKKEITIIGKSSLSSDDFNMININIDELEDKIIMLEEELLSINEEIEYQIKEETKLKIILNNIKIIHANYDDHNWASTNVNEIISKKINKLNEIEKKNQEIKNNLLEKKIINNIEFEMSNDYIIKKIKQNIEILKTVIEDKKDNLYQHKNKIKKISDVKDILIIKTKYNENKIELEKINFKLKKIEINNDNDMFIDQIENEIKKLYIYENEIKYNKDKLKDYEEENKYLLQHKFNENCEDCKHNEEIHNKIDYMKKIKELKKLINNKRDIKKELILLENKKKNKLEIKELREIKYQIENENINLEKLIEIENNNQEIKKQNIIYYNEIEVYENEYKKLQDQYSYIINEYKQYINLINEYNKLELEIKELKDNKIIYENNKEEIQLINESIIDKNNNEKYREDLIKKIKYAEVELTTNKNYISNNNKLINKINIKNDTRSQYCKLLSLYTEDKLIDKMLNNIIYKIEKIANNIMKELTNFTLKFEIDIDGIIIYKHYKNENIDARFLSGYEKFASNIALRIAFNKLNKYVKNDFLIIDEGFSSCDEKNIEKINIVFDIIRKNYKWCLVISHIEQIKNNFDNIYTINKINNVSNDSHIII